MDSSLGFSLVSRGSKNLKWGFFLEGVVGATTNGDSLDEPRVSADGWSWWGREGFLLTVFFYLTVDIS